MAPQVLGADTFSRSLSGFAASEDLGDDCSEVRGPARGERLDVILLDRHDTHRVRALEAQGESVQVLVPTGIDEVLQIYSELGSRFGVRTRALGLKAEVGRKVSRIAQLRDSRTRLQVVWLLGPGSSPGTDEVVGGKGILHELLELAGAENAFHVSVADRNRVSADEIADAGVELLIHGGRVVPPVTLPLVLELRVLGPELIRSPILHLAGRVGALYELLYPEGS